MDDVTRTAIKKALKYQYTWGIVEIVVAMILIYIMVNYL